MMEHVGSWMLGIAAAAFAWRLAEDLTGEDASCGVLRLTGGLLLILALLRPIEGIELSASEMSLPALQQKAAVLAASYEESQLNSLSAIIAGTSESYIWDKACELGISCEVEVQVRTGESALPLPASVTVSAPYDARLAAFLEEEVGIPCEHQNWLEEDLWSEANERE